MVCIVDNRHAPDQGGGPSHHPNEETAKAIEESRKGTEGKTYSSASELFDELDKEC